MRCLHSTRIGSLEILSCSSLHLASMAIRTKFLVWDIIIIYMGLLSEVAYLGIFSLRPE